MIVKVQISLTTSAETNDPWMLVYNEDRSVRFEGPADPEIVRKLGKHKKAFMNAFQLEDSTLDLYPDELLPDQGW